MIQVLFHDGFFFSPWRLCLRNTQIHKDIGGNEIEFQTVIHTYVHMYECACIQLMIEKAFLTSCYNQRSLKVNTVVYSDNFRYKKCR